MQAAGSFVIISSSLLPAAGELAACRSQLSRGDQQKHMHVTGPLYQPFDDDFYLLFAFMRACQRACWRSCAKPTSSQELPQQHAWAWVHTCGSDVTVA
jgi:hypothetical protein